MMLYGPFLISLVPGIIGLTLSWLFSKKGFSLWGRMLPGSLLTIAAAILFYHGYVNIRGFEGAVYGILGFFFIIYALPSFIIGAKMKSSERKMNG
ncbi:hypothetical protein GLW00_08020 [Halobacillus litoralis]|uniref:Preprotein translocase subunit SecD n=1 Tax=Halobacillus litoralis TaxID=45668 RepID=A0A845F982_9BACI|nr:hypothetical protein [Halobacillus litoralis]MYL70793.1 hypothetical protein [Halobacillus litoralis]